MVIYENIPTFATHTNKEKNMKIYLKARLVVNGLSVHPNNNSIGSMPHKRADNEQWRR